MAALPRIVNPIKPLFVRDDVEIALITIEAWHGRVAVRLSGLPSDVTDARQNQHDIEFRGWHAKRRVEGPGVVGTPPTLDEPGWQLLSPLDVTVSDDAGRVYTYRSLHGGGTSRHWDATWFFEDVPFDSLDRLVIHVASPEGESAEVRVDFLS